MISLNSNRSRSRQQTDTRPEVDRCAGNDVFYRIERYTGVAVGNKCFTLKIRENGRSENSVKESKNSRKFNSRNSYYLQEGKYEQ